MRLTSSAIIFPSMFMVIHCTRAGEGSLVPTLPNLPRERIRPVRWMSVNPQLQIGRGGDQGIVERSKCLRDKAIDLT
jgi:hypothetical protein